MVSLNLNYALKRPERGRGVNLSPPPPVVFRKMYSLKRVKLWWLFVTFNIIISHIFPENFIKIPQVVQKIFFFSIWVFFHGHFWITGLQGKGEGISITPYYHFHLLHRHWDISLAIAAESSPLHIASSRTRSRNFWFLSASR